MGHGRSVSPQAQSMLNDLLALGVPRDSLRVRTQPDVGALATARSADAEAAIVQHAKHLADRGLSVSLTKFSCGHSGMPTVANTGGRVENVPMDLPCRTCR